LGGDPVCDVILVDWDGTNRRPAKKTLMPQSRIGRQIVLLNVAPIIVLKFPECRSSGDPSAHTVVRAAERARAPATKERTRRRLSAFRSWRILVPPRYRVVIPARMSAAARAASKISDAGQVQV
jgi:hypothetical protein